MKSLNEIKKLARSLMVLSLDQDGHILPERGKDIVETISSGKIKGIEKTQIVTLLKQYKKLISISLVDDTIVLRSSIALTENEKHEKEFELKKQFKKNNVVFEVNPDMIGGVELQTGWNIKKLTIKKSLDTLIS